MRAYALRPLLLVGGAYHLVLGGWMMLAPRSFYDALASFPPFNDHFLRDSGAFFLAIGAGFVIAAARAPWQGPVLTITVVWYALHVGSHVVDVADTDPGWHGPATLISLAALLAGFAWLLSETGRRRASGRAPQPRDRPPQ